MPMRPATALCDSGLSTLSNRHPATGMNNNGAPKGAIVVSYKICTPEQMKSSDLPVSDAEIVHAQTKNGPRYYRGPSCLGSL
jgi:hypothetical protein